MRVDHGAGHAQVVRVESSSVMIARHGDFELRFLAKHQESALAAGDGESGVDHGGEHFLGRERILQGARHFHQRAQLAEIVSGRLREARA